MVNCGRRALLGGVEVLGDLQAPLLVDLPGLGETLGDAVVALGGKPKAEASPHTRLLWLGEGAPPSALQVTFSDWRGGVFIAGEGDRLGSEKIEEIGLEVVGVARRQDDRGALLAKLHQHARETGTIHFSYLSI